MTATNTRPIRAVVSLDPAGKEPCGLAVRFVEPGKRYQRGHLPKPAWWFQGSVWNASGLHDELGVLLYRHLKPGDRVMYVVENTAYGVRVAKSMGRSIGAIEAILIDLGYLGAQELKYVDATRWRNRQMPGFKPAGTNANQRRAAWKARAVDSVNALYGLGLELDQADAAEAVLINDDTVLHVLPTVGGAVAGETTEDSK